MPALPRSSSSVTLSLHLFCTQAFDPLLTESYCLMQQVDLLPLSSVLNSIWISKSPAMSTTSALLKQEITSFKIAFNNVVLSFWTKQQSWTDKILHSQECWFSIISCNGRHALICICSTYNYFTANCRTASIPSGIFYIPQAVNRGSDIWYSITAWTHSYHLSSSWGSEIRNKSKHCLRCAKIKHRFTFYLTLIILSHPCRFFLKKSTLSPDGWLDETKNESTTMLSWKQQWRSNIWHGSQRPVEQHPLAQHQRVGAHVIVGRDLGIESHTQHTTIMTRAFCSTS